MNSKAIRKQLLAAVAMVLVAAVALGSSTYAWFVASGTVTATGMNVTAQSEGGLAISFGGQAWGTSASAGMEPAKALYPASTKDLADWYHATAADMNASAALEGTRTKITNTVFGGPASAFSPNNYVVMKPFLIKSTAKGKESKGLYVDAITVPANLTMSTALRVGVRYKPASGDAVTKIYGPVVLDGGQIAANKATDNYMVYNENGGELTAVTLDATGQAGSTLIGNTIPISAETPIEVQIFIWFEGEDLNLKSSNFNTEDLAVTVKFSSISGPNGANNTIGKVNLNGATVSTDFVEAKAPGAVDDTKTKYYMITNKKGADYETLYSTTSGALSAKIYTITNGIAAEYNNWENVAPSP